MYNIEYNKITTKNGTLNNISSITIDSDDILMMKYVDILHKGDRNLVILYLKYLKYCYLKRVKPDKFGIKNNSKNENLINSIIACDWLINEQSIKLNIEALEKRKEYFQSEINYFKNSNKSYDKHKCLLMQHFIDSFDKVKTNELTKELK